MGTPVTTAITRIGVALICLAAFIAGAGVASAQDVVITTSGDRLVGEIKRVEKDVLTLSTDYSDVDFKIEWGKIASIESKRQFLVETFDGKRLSGSLALGPDKKPIVLIAGTSLPLAEVSTVQPFERKLWSRFDSALDFGYSMTRTNSAKQLSLGTNLSYRDERYADALFANIFYSSQDNAPKTQRWEVANDFRRLLGIALVHQHHPGLPEQRGAGPGSADDDRRRGRPVSDAFVIPAYGRRRRRGVDQ